MQTSLNGTSLLKEFEGLELGTYQEIAGVWAIGYGHTANVDPDDTITKERYKNASLS